MAFKIPRGDNQSKGDNENLIENEEHEPIVEHSAGARPRDRNSKQTATPNYESMTSRIGDMTHTLPQQRIVGHPIYCPQRRSPLLRTPPRTDGNLSMFGGSGNDWSNREALQNILTQRVRSPDRFLASQGSPYMNNLLNIGTSGDDGMHQKNIKLSRRIPKWIWYLLAKSLGIKLTPTDKPIVATILHVITLTIALLYATTGLWYDISDILSEYSKTTVLIGSVAIMLGLSWICLGIYAHKLAGKLFSNKNFVESVRMHSKTFMKISTVGLLMLLGGLSIGIYAYESYERFVKNDSACSLVGTYTEVCVVMYGSMVAYSIFCLTWNILVGCVLLSVCRTHTISIRRFMRELSLDAKIYEWNLKRERLGQNLDLDVLVDKNYEDLNDWFVWDDRISSDPGSDVVTSQSIFLQSIIGQATVNATYVPTIDSMRQTSVSERMDNSPVSVSWGNPVSVPENGVDPPQKVSGDEINPISYREDDREQTFEPDHANSTEEESPKLLPPQIMPNENLLFSYWKLCQRLTVTSRYLQRWLSSWIAFIMIWCADYIVYWTTHNATLPGISQFILPLLLLLIVCSAYAEVNSEGQRMLRCICPTEERLSILFFMYQQPLQMQVFSFAITYNALLTVILAFSVAFSSRIILDEVLK